MCSHQQQEQLGRVKRLFHRLRLILMFESQINKSTEREMNTENSSPHHYQCDDH